MQNREEMDERGGERGGRGCGNAEDEGGRGFHIGRPSGVEGPTHFFQREGRGGTGDALHLYTRLYTREGMESEWRGQSDG